MERESCHGDNRLSPHRAPQAPAREHDGHIITAERGIARWISLRIDHGNQYTSDRFTKQIKAWGSAPIFAFVEQPETNGVVERFFLTLKEQAIYGRVFGNLEEVRQAVAEFVELYNDQ